jgi:hypothetical protein
MVQTMKTRPVGRPPKPVKERHSEYVCLKLTPDQHKGLLKKAREQKMTVATYIRGCITRGQADI